MYYLFYKYKYFYLLNIDKLIHIIISMSNDFNLIFIFIIYKK